MELKIKVNTIKIKDENAGEEYTIKTVRNAGELHYDLMSTEMDALRTEVDDLASEYID